MTAALGDEGLQEVAEAAPMKRTGSPEDIAGVALYLSSKASGFVCGAVIPVDGGSPLPHELPRLWRVRLSLA